MYHVIVTLKVKTSFASFYVDAFVFFTHSQTWELSVNYLERSAQMCERKILVLWIAAITVLGN